MIESKEVLIESLHLHLRGKPVLDEDGFNSLMEIAPYIGSLVAKSFDMNVGEFRQIIKRTPAELSFIRLRILHCKDL